MEYSYPSTFFLLHVVMGLENGHPIHLLQKKSIDNDNDNDDNEIVYFDINNKTKNIEQKQLLE